MNKQTRARGQGRVNQSRFAQNQSPRVQRSQFNRSRTLKTTISAGLVVPVLVDEILPGDTVRCQQATYVRLPALLHPILEDLVVDFHWWFAPNRILWEHAYEHMGEQDDLSSPTTYLIPQINAPAGGYAVSSVYDYMGLPVTRGPFSHSALPLRAYYKIHDDWYRPQELSAKLAPPTGDGPDAHTLYELKPRYRRHDYFSSCLISPQRGAEVEIPVGGQAPLVGHPGARAGINPLLQGVTSGAIWNPTALSTSTPTGTAGYQGAIGTPTAFEPTVWLSPGMDVGTTAPGGTTPYADLSAVGGLSISAWREAISLQQFLEMEARGGSRYAEIIDAGFGVTVPDRLYRPEYLGGSTTRVNVTPIPQTSQTTTGTDASAQGTLAAIAEGGGASRPWMRSFVEHGVLMCTASLRRANISYQQGLHKMWTRQTRYDHFWPQFSHLSEQEVLSGELFIDGTSADTTTVFGYQERWSEYKYATSIITGEMRSDLATGSLDTWHLADDYDTTRPTLSEEWMREDPPMERIKGVTDAPDALIDAVFGIEHTRCMPVYGVPGLRRL